MMRAGWAIGLVLAGCFSLPAMAEPKSQAQADAAYIVEQTVTADLFEAALEAISPLLIRNLDSEFRRNGRTVSDAALEVLELMIRQEMLRLMVDQMQQGAVVLYVDQFSPEALAGYRAFLETPAGQEIASGTPLLTRESAKLGDQMGQRLGVEAFQNIAALAKAGVWPDGTLPSTQREVAELLAR